MSNKKNWSKVGVILLVLVTGCGPAPKSGPALEAERLVREAKDKERQDGMKQQAEISQYFRDHPDAFNSVQRERNEAAAKAILDTYGNGSEDTKQGAKDIVDAWNKVK